MHIIVEPYIEWIRRHNIIPTIYTRIEYALFILIFCCFFSVLFIYIAKPFSKMSCKYLVLELSKALLYKKSQFYFIFKIDNNYFSLYPILMFH